MTSEAELLNKSPLLINKIVAERLSDKIQVVMVPSDGKFFFANDVFKGMANSPVEVKQEMDSKDEGLHPVNRRADRKIGKDMDRMLHSFTFVGPVKDGPDWDVYVDSDCGHSFEYPSLATVDEVLKYSAAFNPSRITCEEAFTYNGREYTVVVKDDLKDDNAVNNWLSFKGYPDLERMKIVVKEDDFTEYSDQTHAYLRAYGDLFILTVSGANHQPIPFEGDRVFAHLLESFRAR
jgi:hypothetical protein